MDDNKKPGIIKLKAKPTVVIKLTAKKPVQTAKPFIKIAPAKPGVKFLRIKETPKLKLKVKG